MHDPVTDVLGEPVRGDDRLLATALGQVEVGQPSVQDLVGVEDLAVADEVDGRHAGTAAAAAFAAPGSAAAMRSIAASSWAALRNQDSYALGGR